MFEVPVHRHLARHVAAIGLCIGVDEHHQLATAQDELIDGVQRRLGQVLRMHQPQHRDVVRDQVEISLEGLDVEQLTHLFQNHPRRRRLPRHHVEAAGHGQPGQHTDYRQLGLGQGLHQAAQLVLQVLLLIQSEERNHLGVVQRIGAGQAEVDGITTLLQRDALQAEFGGLVLVFGERFGVDDVQANLAVRLGLVGLEHLLHTLGVGAQRRQILGHLVRIEEVQVDRLVQLTEDLPGAVGDGVELLFGQIQAHAAQAHTGQQVEGDEGHRDQQQPGAGIDQLFHGAGLSQLSSDR